MVEPKDTVYADVSYYQKPYDRAHYVDEHGQPMRWLSIRSNDGDFVDPNFAHNIVEMGDAIAAGQLVGGEVYYVYRPGGKGVATHQKLMIAALAAIAKKHGAATAKKIFSVQDIESWNGAIKGDHSQEIRAEREQLIKKVHGGNRRAVKMYANEGDRNSICPSWGDAQWIIANYTRNPKLKDQLAHQYANNLPAGAFGAAVDRNSADGYTPRQYLAAHGYVEPKATTGVGGKAAKTTTWGALAAAVGLSVAALLAANDKPSSTPSTAQVPTRVVVPGTAKPAPAKTKTVTRTVTVKAPAPKPAPAAKPKPATKPKVKLRRAWPGYVKAGQYFGPVSGPAASLGGYHATERPGVKAIQQRLIALGYVPGVTSTASPWADGRWEGPTTAAWRRYVKAHGGPTKGVTKTAWTHLFTY